MLLHAQDVVGAIAVVAITAAPFPARAQHFPLPLVPYPSQVEQRAGATRLDSTWSVRVVADPAASVGIEGLLMDVRQAWGWVWPLEPREGGRSVVIRPRAAFGAHNALMESQGYELRIERDSIVIAAPTEIGRFYGVQTLRQLLRGYPSGALPRLVIRDYPSLPWRGILDDISRGQASTLADFRATLEHLGLYKINLYFLYLEDMARFWSAPEVGADRGALTPSELHWITQEARRHHITVVPIFQTLGHQERLLAYPAFRRYAERQRPAGLAAWVRRTIWTLLPAAAQACGIQDPAEEGPAPSCFSPVLPETRRRVMELMDEIAAAVPSPFFHIGGDEPSDLGRGTSRKAVARDGFGAVYADYMSTLATHVAKVQRRQPIIFGDVLLKDSLAMDRMPKDVAVMDWHYDPTDSGGSIRKLRRAGFRTVFASPGLWNWFAIYPDYGRAFPNIDHLARAARDYGASGLVVASWGDGGAESLRRANGAGYAYAADASWRSPAHAEDFLDRFVAVEYGGPSPALSRAERLLGWQAFPTLGHNQRLFHLKPRLRTHNADWVTRMAALDRDMAEVRRSVAGALPALRFGRARVDVLDHAAARFQYAARRELTMEDLAGHLGARPWTSLGDPERMDRLSAIGALRDSSIALAGRYDELWRRDNRRPMLAPLLARLRQQTAALDTMMSQAHRGTLRREL